MFYRLGLVSWQCRAATSYRRVMATREPGGHRSTGPRKRKLSRMMPFTSAMNFEFATAMAGLRASSAWKRCCQHAVIRAHGGNSKGDETIVLVAS